MPNTQRVPECGVRNGRRGKRREPRAEGLDGQSHWPNLRRLAQAGSFSSSPSPFSRRLPASSRDPRCSRSSDAPGRILRPLGRAWRTRLSACDPPRFQCPSPCRVADERVPPPNLPPLLGTIGPVAQSARYQHRHQHLCSTHARKPPLRLGLRVRAKRPPVAPRLRGRRVPTSRPRGDRQNAVSAAFGWGCQVPCRNPNPAARFLLLPADQFPIARSHVGRLPPAPLWRQRRRRGSVKARGPHAVGPGAWPSLMQDRRGLSARGQGRIGEDFCGRYA